MNRHDRKCPDKSGNGNPNIMNRPIKHFRLVCWRLLYHIDVQKSLDRQDEIDACRHARFDLAKWDEEKARCPKEWAKLLAKRQRRLAWFRQHGKVPNGWTPPDPKDPRRSAHKPIHAFLARRGYSVDEFRIRYALVPLARKKGGHHPPMHAIYRAGAWLNTCEAVTCARGTSRERIKNSS